jgi:hypothetical protein
MWGAIKSFFVKIFWPSLSKLLKRLTPVVADTALKLAYSKASELKGKTSKKDRKRVEGMLIGELKAKGLTIGVDYTLEELENAAKAAIRKSDEIDYSSSRNKTSR